MLTEIKTQAELDAQCNAPRPGPVCSDTEGGWWAIYTKHQHEKVAAEIIAAKGADVFLPLYQTMRRWKDRRVKLSVPLFPCYLFVRAQAALRVDIITTPGIHMIVSQAGKLALVSPTEIEALRRVLQKPDGVQPYPYLRTGERVRVTGGVLEGVEGMLVRQKNQCRVVISVDMLARSAAVEVNAWDVMPISASRGSLRTSGSMKMRAATTFTSMQS